VLSVMSPNWFPLARYAFGHPACEPFQIFKAAATLYPIDQACRLGCQLGKLFGRTLSVRSHP
jgi:hypothetical protein